MCNSPRYSYHHKLIPLLLTCVTDEVPEIKQKSHDLWEKVSTSQICTQAFSPQRLSLVACHCHCGCVYAVLQATNAGVRRPAGGGGGGGGGGDSKTHYDCIISLVIVIVVKHTMTVLSVLPLSSWLCLHTL